MKCASPLIFALALTTLTACGGGGSSGPQPSNTGDANSGNEVSEQPVSGLPTQPPAPVTPDSGETPLSGEDGASQDPVIADGLPPNSMTGQNFLALSWTIPATREDGTYLPVYEIAGYELRYSKDSGTEVTIVPIHDPQTTEWVIENVTPGQYDFSIATIDSDGVYSHFSLETSAQVQ